MGLVAREGLYVFMFTFTYVTPEFYWGEPSGSVAISPLVNSCSGSIKERLMQNYKITGRKNLRKRKQLSAENHGDGVSMCE